MTEQHTLTHTVHTFLAEHAVTERHLSKHSILLQSLGQHGAGIRREALTTQVQFAALSTPALLERSHNTLLGLQPRLLTQTQESPPEVLHSGSAES